MNRLITNSLVLIFIIFSWQLIIYIFSLPDYILPSPFETLTAFIENKKLLFHHACITIFETFLGLALGIIIGMLTAILMTLIKPIRTLLLPLVITSQSIPTFAIAPLLVIWFGYGLTSKIIVTVLMIFFPITSSFYDGLISTPAELIDLAKTMHASKLKLFIYIQIPAALPSLASGIRVASAIAPIGAVVGEWVGASQGLGYLMLNANARMQIDLMFAALISIILFSLLLFFIIDVILKSTITWNKELL